VGRSVIDRDEFGELEIPEKVAKVLDICLAILLDNSAEVQKIRSK
jgi:hypothetical protein